MCGKNVLKRGRHWDVTFLHYCEDFSRSKRSNCEWILCAGKVSDVQKSLPGDRVFLSLSCAQCDTSMNTTPQCMHWRLIASSDSARGASVSPRIMILQSRPLTRQIWMDAWFIRVASQYSRRKKGELPAISSTNRGRDNFTKFWTFKFNEKVFFVPSCITQTNFENRHLTNVLEALHKRNFKD